MTTARTHLRQVNRGAGATPLTGTARPQLPSPKPDDFTPVSAETFPVPETVSPEGSQDDPPDPSGLSFDPAEHTAAQVEEFVRENPDTAELIKELEENGKARSGLLSFLDNFIETEGDD